VFFFSHNCWMLRSMTARRLGSCVACNNDS
jgi:hypothetical protein